MSAARITSAAIAHPMAYLFRRARRYAGRNLGAMTRYDPCSLASRLPSRRVVSLPGMSPVERYERRSEIPMLLLAVAFLVAYAWPVLELDLTPT